MKDNLSHSIVSACKGTKKKWNMQNKIYFFNSDIAFLLLWEAQRLSLIRRKSACSSFRAGWSFEKSGYWGIERAKGQNE